MTEEMARRVRAIHELETQVPCEPSSDPNGEPETFVTSLQKPYGDPFWRAGKVNRVKRHYAVRQMVDGHVRMATDEEIAGYHKAQREREIEILKTEQSKKQQSVLVQSDTDVETIKALKAEISALKEMIQSAKPESGSPTKGKKNSEVQ